MEGALPRGIPFPSILSMKEMEQTEELNTGCIHLFGDLEGC